MLSYISSKNLFSKLKKHSKNLPTQQEEIINKHNSLTVQYDELEHLKVNMNSYLSGDKIEKKESAISAIREHQNEERDNSKEKSRISKDA